MADPQETTIIKAIETALDAIKKGDTELGWTYVRTPYVERSVVWSGSNLKLNHETIYTLTPVRIDPVELGGKRTRNKMSLILVMAGQARDGQNFANNSSDRWDCADELYHEARTRLMYSYFTSGQELAALKSSAGLLNIEIVMDEYGGEIEGLAAWQISFAEITVTYTVQYP